MPHRTQEENRTGVPSLPLPPPGPSVRKGLSQDPPTFATSAIQGYRPWVDLKLKLAYMVLPLFAGPMALGAEQLTPHFEAVEIDSNLQIGYGVAVADIDGDRRPDVLLADKRQVVWYRNPGWTKFLVAEKLTELDNVCIAAADLDGDGKAEVAVGAGWNPSDTTGSGALFFLEAPEDRTQPWRPVTLPHEPTVHRMRWIKTGPSAHQLAVLPLHGRGNRDGRGEGVRFLTYRPPAGQEGAWTTTLVDDSLHLTHNFDVVKWTRQPSDELLVAGREGIFHFVPHAAGWKRVQLAGNAEDSQDFAGAGEVRAGRLPCANAFFVTIEPMHGNELVVYTAPSINSPGPLWNRLTIDSDLKEGHALACGDLLNAGSDQVVAGWRGRNSKGKTGIQLYSPADAQGGKWSAFTLDDNTIACEDLCLADLDGNGALDIVAAGRATRNLKLYLNRRPDPRQSDAP